MCSNSTRYLICNFLTVTNLCFFLLVETKKSKKKKLYPCNRCKTKVQNSKSSIACDSCLEWYHMACEKLTRVPNSKNFFCMSCRK